MAVNDYKLIKEVSGGFYAEKNVPAEAGKAISFDEDLDPVMTNLSRVAKIESVTLAPETWVYNSGASRYEYRYINDIIVSTDIVQLVPMAGDYTRWKDAEFHPEVVPSAGECIVACFNEPNENIRVTFYVIGTTI